MRLGREVDYRVGAIGKRVHESGVADVAVEEPVALLTFELHQVREIPRVCELVEHCDLDLGPRLPHQPHEVGTDETRGSGDEDPPERSCHLMAGPAVQSYPMSWSSCGIRPSSSGS